MTHPGPPRPPRRFISDEILQGLVNLDGYPLRYICVTPAPMAMRSTVRTTFGMPDLSEIDKVLSAVELLETRGWELVTIEKSGTVAFLRRRAPHP